MHEGIVRVSQFPEDDRPRRHTWDCYPGKVGTIPASPVWIADNRDVKIGDTVYFISGLETSSIFPDNSDAYFKYLGDVLQQGIVDMINEYDDGSEYLFIRRI